MGSRRSAGVPKRRTLKIRSGDRVRVISGKDRGKSGRVLRTEPANERVYVEGEQRRHLRAGTVQPPPRLALAGVRDRTLVWHIIQSTEGSTLDGIVSVRFGPGGSGGAAACSRSP